MIQLPDWMDCARRYGNGEKLNPLEEFILDNEPAGKEAEREFLEGLRAAIEYVLEQDERNG